MSLDARLAGTKSHAVRRQTHPVAAIRPPPPASMALLRLGSPANAWWGVSGDGVSPFRGAHREAYRRCLGTGTLVRNMLQHIA